MLAGIIKRTQAELDLSTTQETLLQSINQFDQNDRVDCWKNDHAILAASLRFNTPESKFESLPLVYEKQNLIILFWGRLTNRTDLIEKLGVKKKAGTIPDYQLVLSSIEKWKEHYLEHLYGDFSIVVYHTGDNTIQCVTDHMGNKPVYYYIDQHYFVFCSNLTLFQKLKFISIDPSIEWAAKYVMHLSMDFEKTPYPDICKLSPATAIQVTPFSDLKTKYFQFDSITKTKESFEDCIEHYRAILDDAVKTRIHTDYALGSETSGGLDSSTVTALAARHFQLPKEKFYAFGLVTSENEPEYVLHTSLKYQIQNNYFYCDAPSMDDDILQRSIEAMGYPCEHGNATLHIPFYLECQKNDVRTLLSGFGGDEFTTHNYSNIILKELWHKKGFREVFKNQRGSGFTAFLRTLKFFYREKLKSPDQYNPRLFNAWKERFPFFPVKEDFLTNHTLKDVYFDRAKFDVGYEDVNQFVLENRFAPFVPTRMNNCAAIADSYGIDYAWPLLDVRLIQYFLSVPTEYKIRDGVPRYFHKKAMDKIVPDKVNWKNGKYMGEVQHEILYRKVTLSNDLHPCISDFIDVDKARLNLKENNVDNLNKFRTIRQSTSAINLIDLWLKTYYPKGCSWKIDS